MKAAMLLALSVIALFITACGPQVVDTDGDGRVAEDEREARGDTTVNVDVNTDDDADTVVVNNTTVVRETYVPIETNRIIVVERDETERDDEVIVEWTAGEQERNEDIAREFIEGTATYQSDGSDLELVSSEKLPTNPPLLVYEFTYTSEGEGYGDRDTVVGEETEHDVRIIIMNGEIVSAITDDVWNELTRRPVTQSGPSAQGESCGNGVTCAGSLYCFRMSDATDAQGICIEQA